MRKISKLLVFLGIISLVLISFFLVTVSLLFFSIEYSNGSNVGHGESYEYRMTVFNPSTNRAKRSIVTLPHQIQEGEDLSYRDSNGNSVLISHFESKERVCYVTCFCDEGKEGEDEERNFFSRRGAWKPWMNEVLVICAISGLIGQWKVNVLKKRRAAREQCMEFAPACPPGSIRSEDIKCYDITDEFNEFPLDEEDFDLYDDEEEIERGEQDEDERKVVCSGSCVPEEYRLPTNKERQCERKKLQGVFDLDDPKDILARREKFRMVNLSPFCLFNEKSEFMRAVKARKYPFPAMPGKNITWAEEGALWRGMNGHWTDDGRWVWDDEEGGEGLKTCSAGGYGDENIVCFAVNGMRSDVPIDDDDFSGNGFDDFEEDYEW